MEWFGFIVATLGAGLTARWWRTRQTTRLARDEDLQHVRRLADEDVTCLGEHLQRFDREVGAQSLDAEVQATYRTAVESYESARSAIAQISEVGQVSRVTDAIATGHNKLAAARALLAGRPVPEQRVMCFFNPQHGPSAADVSWTRPGYGERRVPACSQDARRVADNNEPEARMVTVGTRTTPYWTAGTAFLPYARGYFASAATLSWAWQPEVPDAAAATARSGHLGAGIVGSSGHFDGGGFDGSGAPPD